MKKLPDLLTYRLMPLLFAAIVDVDSGRPAACADHSGSAGGVATSTALGSECLRVARDVCREMGVSPARRVFARSFGDAMRLFGIFHGRHALFVAAPSADVSSAFSSIALCADVSARWDMAAIMRRESLSPMDDAALLGRLVHFSSVQNVGDDAFAAADRLASTGTTGGLPDGGPTAPAAFPMTPATWRSAAPGGGIIVGAASSAEIARSQAGATQLAAKVAELEQSKSEMEEHSAALLAELRTVREQQLEQLRAYACIYAHVHARVHAHVHVHLCR